MSHPLDALTTLSTGEDRDEWLRARANPALITATQATSIVGSNPYTKLIDVYNEKTDPDYDGEHLRNIYLEERASLGSEREPEIIAWATLDPITGGPDAPFIPNTRLVEHPDRPGYGCTPDGAKLVGKKLVLIECKATQQRWDKDGVPQHILDQCYWQIHVTGAVTVWLAVEFYEWKGRGKNKVPTKVGQWLKPIQQNERRIAFILSEVDKFNGWVADGIAPESDVILNHEPQIDFDDSPDDIAEKVAQAAEAKRLDALLTELDGIEQDIAEKSKRASAIKAQVKKVVSLYDGRRVHLIGERMIAQLVRFNSEKVDTSKLDEKTLQEITSWRESERMTVVPNPEFDREAAEAKEAAEAAAREADKGDAN